MTDKQTEALKIAYVMEQKAEKQKTRLGDYWTDDWCFDAAAELRRLHEVNAELVEALSDMIDTYQYEASPYNESLLKAKTTLAKATGENND